MPFSIAHVTTAHPARDNRIFRKESASLASAGYTVTLIAPSDVEFSGYGVQGQCLKRRTGRFRRMTLGPLEALRQVLTLRPDLVHAHDPELIPALLLLKLVLPNVRIVYDSHEDLPAQVESKPYISPRTRRLVSVFAQLLDWLVARVADGIIVATPAIANNFPSEKTTVIQNFPLLEDYPRSAAKPTHTVVYVGALTEIRGAEQMFDALEGAASGVRCIMAGSIQPSVAPRAERNTRLDYLGALPPEEVPSVISRGSAGIVCFLPYPNHLDAQPNKLFEYMAAGRAVICSDFPLWRDLLEPFNCAYFVDPEDPDQLRRVLDYVENHPAEVAEMGRRAREAFETHFVFDGEATALFTAYKNILV